MKRKFRLTLTIFVISTLLVIPAAAQVSSLSSPYKEPPSIGIPEISAAVSGNIFVTTTADDTASDGLCSLREAVQAVSTNSAVDGCPAVDGNSPESNIVVTTLVDESDLNGYCSLREAIQAANTDLAVDACPAGTWPGADTISFSVSGTINLTAQLDVTGTGPLVIDGFPGITLSGGGSVRIFSLSNTAVLTLVDVSLLNGHAVEGGAIKNLSSLTLWDSAISGSQATGASTGGGGIYNSGTLKIINSTLSGNEASSGSGRGGAVYNNLGTVYLTNATLSGNHAANDGGGIYSLGTLYVANATLTDNSAGDIGGGIYTAGYSFYLRNSILAKNSAATDGPDCYSSNITSQGYNLVGRTIGCEIYPGTGDMIGVDPKLGLLQDNGGLTSTHELLSGSLAIDHGNPYMCVDYLGYWVDIDQRGFDRSNRCDIGAYEWQPEAAAGPYTLFLPCVLGSCSTRLFFDDFSQPVYGWPNYENVYARYEYLNGEYRILAKDRPNDTWAMSFPGNEYSDYVLEVDVRNADSATGHYGFAFDMKGDWSQVYFFLVDNSGNYVIMRSDHGWLSNGYSPYIHTGTAANHLKLERNGNLIWAYANGELLAILYEPTSGESRYLGLVSIATVATVDARFDNFAVLPITCGRSYTYPAFAADLDSPATMELAPPDNWVEIPRTWEIGR